MDAPPGQSRPGEWLRQQRAAAGLTQEDLAERSGVSVRAIADLERGRTRKPYPSSVRALAGALGLPPSAAADLVASYRAGWGHGAVTPTVTPPVTPAGAAGAAAAASGTPAGITVPRQLPTPVPHFAGRSGELALLDRALPAAASNGAAAAAGVTICAISGTAGVGKTALALHWAHRVASRFPDGQLYANLRGFDPGGGPADPADVLRGFLDALGVPPERRPADADGLAALCRSVLAGRRMLVLLDNAADGAQVRPLLPASPACLVIVTSRDDLAALAAREGARLLRLDVLSAPEASELLIARLGPERAAAEPSAVPELATLCARLPLALSVVVARAAAAPNLPLPALAAELTELAGRLDALDAGDPAANVRTVLSLSYRHLPEPAARMFRLLGLHPGPDISAAAAASLTGAAPAAARAALRGLTRASLLTEVTPGRYAFHDLLRVYAAEQYNAADGIEAATRRLLDHYLHTAHRAQQLLYPGRELIGLDPPAAGVSPEAFSGKASALAWLEAEDQVLLKVTELAARAGFDVHASRLPVVLYTFHHVCGPWLTRARACCLQAIELCQAIGYSPGEAGTWDTLGVVLHRLGRPDEAVPCFLRAASLSREMGVRYDLAMTLAHLGETYHAVGDSRGARAAWDEALTILRALQHPAAGVVRGQLAALAGDREVAVEAAADGSAS